MLTLPQHFLLLFSTTIPKHSVLGIYQSKLCLLVPPVEMFLSVFRVMKARQEITSLS